MPTLISIPEHSQISPRAFFRSFPDHSQIILISASGVCWGRLRMPAFHAPPSHQPPAGGGHVCIPLRFPFALCSLSATFHLIICDLISLCRPLRQQHGVFLGFREHQHLCRYHLNTLKILQWSCSSIGLLRLCRVIRFCFLCSFYPHKKTAPTTITTTTTNNKQQTTNNKQQTITTTTRMHLANGVPARFRWQQSDCRHGVDTLLDGGGL
jgi:hypothetical protein